MEVQPARPVFTALSLSAVVLALPLAKLVIAVLQKEDLLGYGAIGVALLVLMGCLLSGFVLGLVGWFRRERPRALCGVALIVNSLALFWLFETFPFIVGNT